MIDDVAGQVFAQTTCVWSSIGAKRTSKTLLMLSCNVRVNGAKMCECQRRTHRANKRQRRQKRERRVRAQLVAMQPIIGAKLLVALSTKISLKKQTLLARLMG